MTLRTIGKYELLEELGRGGFAVVYRARDTALDRVVALKVLHPHWVTDPQFATRFRQEARAAANLRHPNIVTVHDTGEADGQLYIAMAYLPGRTLQDLLEEQGALPLDAALPILDQLADALDYAHGQGVIHRDVKPLNVMVEDTARGPRATLMDFGLAKALESSTALTSQGTLLGSPEYMAPEQADPNRHAEIGPATDRYALGVVAYRMLTGRVPFPGNTPGTLNAHLNLKVPDPRDFVQDLPLEVTDVLVTILAKAPADRFSTASAFVARLREIVAGYKCQAPVPPAPTRRLSIPLRYWLGAGGIVLVFLAFVILQTLNLRGKPAPAAKQTLPITLTWTLGTPPTSTSTPIASPTAAPTKTPTATPTTIAATPTIVLSDALRLISPENNAVYVAQERNGIVFEWDWILKDQVIVDHFDILASHDSNNLVPFMDGAISGEGSWDFRSATGTFYWKVIAYSKQISYTSEISKIEFRVGEVGDTWIRLTDDMVMVYVPGGTFQMGSNSGGVDEIPIHSVTLSAFWMDQTEITNAQYAKCVTAGTCAGLGCVSGSSFSGPQQPVVCVSWENARDYCIWAGAQLPTEAQWEYTARGPEEYIYPWGNTFDGTRVNFCDNNCTHSWADKSVNDGFEFTAPVGSFPEGRSWVGALDMAGNVSEWTADWYSAYSSEAQTDPEGPAAGDSRVARGMGWGSDKYTTRSSYRFTPSEVSLNGGFRCAVMRP